MWLPQDNIVSVPVICKFHVFIAVTFEGHCSEFPQFIPTSVITFLEVTPYLAHKSKDHVLEMIQIFFPIHRPLSLSRTFLLSSPHSFLPNLRQFDKTSREFPCNMKK